LKQTGENSQNKEITNANQNKAGFTDEEIEQVVSEMLECREPVKKASIVDRFLPCTF